MRTVLTTLADRCAVRRARERCVERVQVDDHKYREQLLTASRLMDNALILLDESDCGLPATKLAEAIQCLHLAMSCGRALDP